MRITPTLAAALAIAALAPAAQAQPPDMHASTAQATARARQMQDFRSPGARDAAKLSRDGGKTAPRPLPGPPAWPANPRVIEPTAYSSASSERLRRRRPASTSAVRTASDSLRPSRA